MREQKLDLAPGKGVRNTLEEARQLELNGNFASLKLFASSGRRNGKLGVGA